MTNLKKMDNEALFMALRNAITWVSVKDRLPEEGEQVLVWCFWPDAPKDDGLDFRDYGFYSVGYRDGNTWEFMDIDADGLMEAWKDRVSYWKPVFPPPLPPEERDETTD